MATDDERRRVAAAFRRYREETTNREFASLFDVFDACGLTYYDGVVLYDRLADLIDPDCDEGRYEGVHTARPVDRDALLELADDVDGAADDSGGFEPLAGMLRDIARRIREACGVVA